MMRAGAGLDQKAWARLFHDYLDEGSFQAGNFGAGQKVSLMRAVPHDGAVAPEEYVEVLDQFFDDPGSKSHAFLRAVVGGSCVSRQ